MNGMKVFAAILTTLIAYCNAKAQVNLLTLPNACLTNPGAVLAVSYGVPYIWRCWMYCGYYSQRYSTSGMECWLYGENSQTSSFEVPCLIPGGPYQYRQIYPIGLSITLAYLGMTTLKKT
ncbi:unnamed protein product [Owenia fusiformis]|uniref:Uncharacterized protein n=1 Tax=Owenia fusiformis TaxID=6347 RepID=A0A8S4N2N7_OWEFU|nr:unnamed protein product [Owenia fusiformis]